MPTAAGVVVEKGSEYTLAHTGQRELDGRPQGGAWVGIIPGRFRGDCDRESLQLYCPFGKGTGQQKSVI